MYDSEEPIPISALMCKIPADPLLHLLATEGCSVEGSHNNRVPSIFPGDHPHLMSPSGEGATWVSQSVIRS